MAAPEAATLTVGNRAAKAMALGWHQRRAAMIGALLTAVTTPHNSRPLVLADSMRPSTSPGADAASRWQPQAWHLARNGTPRGWRSLLTF
jgi:hypothetical protein